MKKFQILIFGASTTHGNWDILGGWANRLRLHVIKKILANQSELHGHVFNLGIPGDMTADLLKRIEPEIKARLFYPETVILVSAGTNDSRLRFSDKKPFTSTEQFRKNVENICKITKKYSNKVLFVGYTPVDEKRTNPWGKEAFLNKRIKKFDDIVRSVCDERKVPFVRLFEVFETKDFLRYVYDGLHPNSLGHEKMFDLIKPFIDKFIS